MGTKDLYSLQNNAVRIQKKKVVLLKPSLTCFVNPPEFFSPAFKTSYINVKNPVNKNEKIGQ